MDLFNFDLKILPGTPLAEKLRPKTPDQVLGQQQIKKILQRVRKNKTLPSLILWGPPGTGKTSFALSLIGELEFYSVTVNAIEIGAKSLREMGAEAKERRSQIHQQTVIFIDEIHRLNKAQQDVLLPFIERGEFILIGATTENPSYELNRALMSRCELIVFERLSEPTLRSLLTQAFELNKLTEEAISAIIDFSDGDARKLLSVVEILIGHLSGLENLTDSQSNDPLLQISRIDLEKILSAKSIGYDRAADQHYDVISAFIKSIRGSDADAGLYYLARMLKAGESPSFIARRLIILASEDVGNADPNALPLAIAGAQAVEMIGLPEAAINLAQLVTYLSCAPKSNRSYLALKKAQEFVEKTGTQPIPLHLRSAKTELMKSLGYGKDYQYPHDFPKHHVTQNYFPEKLEVPRFYEPSERGFEKKMNEYLLWLKSH